MSWVCDMIFVLTHVLGRLLKQSYVGDGVYIWLIFAPSSCHWASHSLTQPLFVGTDKFPNRTLMTLLQGRGGPPFSLSTLLSMGMIQHRSGTFLLESISSANFRTEGDNKCCGTMTECIDRHGKQTHKQFIIQKPKAVLFDNRPPRLCI